MKRRLSLGILIAAVLLISGGVILFVTTHRSKPAPAMIPTTIRKQVSFVVYLPASDWQISAATISYQAGVLHMSSSKADTDLVITEQATPSIFNDVPQYYPSLLDKLNQYSSLGTANGTAYLTKPKELNGQQQAVLNNNGTLLFAHPSQNLSTDDWRRFFNDLQLLKP